MLLLSALVGANYGANLAIFPSITKDYYGLKNFGVNYGLVFTAWGFGGFLLAQAASKIYDELRRFHLQLLRRRRAPGAGSGGNIRPQAAARCA